MGARVEQTRGRRRDARGRTDAGRGVRLSCRVRTGSRTDFGDRSRATRAQRSGGSARDLGLDHDCSAPAGDFPPQAPSSANAARASPDGKVKSQTKTWTTTTAKPTAEYVRSGLQEMKGKVTKEPPGRRELCRLVAEREVDQTVEALAYSEAAGETRRKRRGSKHHRAPSMSESSPSSDASGAADENLVRRLAARRLGALCQSGLAATQRHQCMAKGDDREVAVLRAQGLVVANLTRAVFPHQGARLRRTLGPRRRCHRPDAGQWKWQLWTAWSIAQHLDVIPDARVSSSTPSLRATAVAAERELQKLRGKVDTTPTKGCPTSANRRAQRPDNDHLSAVDHWQRQDSYKQPRRNGVRRSGTRREA